MAKAAAPGIGGRRLRLRLAVPAQAEAQYQPFDCQKFQAPHGLP